MSSADELDMGLRKRREQAHGFGSGTRKNALPFPGVRAGQEDRSRREPGVWARVFRVPGARHTCRWGACTASGRTSGAPGRVTGMRWVLVPRERTRVQRPEDGRSRVCGSGSGRGTSKGAWEGAAVRTEEAEGPAGMGPGHPAGAPGQTREGLRLATGFSRLEATGHLEESLAVKRDWNGCHRNGGWEAGPCSSAPPGREFCPKMPHGGWRGGRGGYSVR